MTGPASVARQPARPGVIRGFLALGLGEAVSRLIGFAATVYAARRLGAAGYGTIGFAAAVVLYANRVVDAGIELGLGVREVAASPDFVSRAAASILAIRTALALAAVVVVGGAALLLLPEPDGVVLAVQSLTLIAVGMGTRWIHLGQHRAGTAAVAAIAGQSVMALVVLLLVRSIGDVAMVPAAQVAGDMVTAIVLMVALGRLPLRFDPAVVRPLVGRSSHLVASALLGIAIYSAGLIVLRATRGAAEAGYFTAAYALVTFFLNVGAMYNLSFLPSLTRAAADRDQRQALFHDAVAQMLALGLPLAVGGTMLAGPAIALLYGGGYSPAAIALSLLVWSIPLNFLRDVSLMALMAEGRERSVFLVTVIGAVVSLGLAAALAPSFGLAGAGVATLLAELVRLLAAGWLAGGRGYGWPGWRRVGRPLVATAMMALALGGLGALRSVPLPLAAIAGAVVYGAAIFGLGGIVRGPNGRLMLRV